MLASLVLPRAWNWGGDSRSAPSREMPHHWPSSYISTCLVAETMCCFPNPGIFLLSWIWWLIFFWQLCQAIRMSRYSIRYYSKVGGGEEEKVFVGEIDIWIRRLSETDCAPQCGWASFNQLKIWIEQRLTSCQVVRILLPDCFPAGTVGFVLPSHLDSSYIIARPPACWFRSWDLTTSTSAW